MKKFKFLSLIALTVALGACDDYELPNPPGQTNLEPTGIFTDADFELTPVSTQEAPIDLLAFNNANEFVPVAEITKLDKFPADYELVVDMEIGNNDNFQKLTTLNTVIDGNVVTVNPDFINGAIKELLSKKPDTTFSLPVRFVAYAVKDNTKLRLGGLDAVYGASDFQVKSLPAAKVIEDAYYLVGDFCNWDANRAIKMINTNPSVSVYDNPEWAYKMEVTSAGLEWKILSASQLEASKVAGRIVGALGCNPSATSDFAGKLGEAYPAGKISVISPMLITVNIEEEAYDVKYALDVLYPISGTTKPENALLLYTSNYIDYTGVTVLGASWKCLGQPDVNGDIYFMGDKDVEIVDSEDGLTRTGGLKNGKDGELLRSPVKGTHLYWLDINLVRLTYSMTCLETITVIGKGNDWKLDTAVPLTPSKDFKTWTAKGVKVGEGFKLNCNGAWDIDFGGGAPVSNLNGTIVYNLTMKGGDCTGTAADKTYDITVDFSTYPYTMVLK